MLIERIMKILPETGWWREATEGSVPERESLASWEMTPPPAALVPLPVSGRNDK